MKLHKISLSAIMCLVATTLLLSCGSNNKNEKKHTSGTTTMACDASFQNIMEQEIQVFEYKYNTEKNNANVLTYYVDEATAIDSLLNLSVRLAVASRPLSNKEIKYLRGQKRNVRQEAIAVDAVALIVNPQNPMEFIDHQDLVDILSGKYITWDKIIPDPKKLTNIKVVFDGQRSSMVRYMSDSLLSKAPFGPNVVAKPTPQEVFETVAKDKNAIGIIGVSWITHDMKSRELSAAEMTQLSESEETANATEFNSDVKVLAVQPKGKLQSYLPYQHNIYSGDYPYHRQIYLISTGAPHSLTHSFYTFVTSVIGQKIILMTGICPKIIEPQFVQLQ